MEGKEEGDFKQVLLPFLPFLPLLPEWQNEIEITGNLG